jgi:hypothetical protein
LRDPVGGAVEARRLAWALLFVVLGVLLVGAWLPGSSGWGVGPRVGAATALFVLGGLLLLFPAVHWILRKTTRPEDYDGGCPVGKTCACGHFNFKPRSECRQCGAATGL